MEKKNPSYDGYRFLAFFGVFLFHWKILAAGYLGVQAFFVLSGFLLTPILIRSRETSANLGAYLKTFYIRRSLRIFPLYFFYLLSLMGAIWILGLYEVPYFHSLSNQMVYAFTYTFNFYHQSTFFEHNKFISHFWSLAVEEQFYLIWPFIVFFFRSKNLKIALVFLCLSGPLFRLFQGYFSDIHLFDSLSYDKNLVVYVSIFSHLDAFAIGGLMALIPSGLLKKRHILIFIFSVIFIGLITNFISEGAFYLGTLGYGPFMNNSGKYIWGYSLINLSFGLIIYGLKEKGFFQSFFGHPIMVSLGIISYGLYVYHYGIIYVFENLKDHIFGKGLDIPSIIYIAGAFLVTVGISWLSYHFFENKFIQLKEKWAPKTK